jgi:hypothetical protein
MAGSGGELAAGAGDRNRLRASDADREQVIEVLKTAFVQGRLTKDEFSLRVTQAYASRTYADLDALTADIPAPPTKAHPPKPAPEPDPDRKKLAALGGLAGMLTWYDVLGVLPGASPGQVESAYQERARLLDLRMLNGAPSKVLKAADTARATVGEAWHILQDAAARRRYDELIAVGRNGEGLGSALSTPSVPGGSAFGRYVTADGVIAALEDLLMPHPSPSRRVIVPDLRGLFMRSCLQVIGDLGLHVEMVQLTEHPMPVEGLVVDQSPLPGAEVSRSSTLTVEIWHPPSRSVVSGVLRISRHYVASSAFRDTRHGLVLGGSAPGTPTTPSVVAATADGGTTWSQVGSPADFRPNMALVRDTAVAVGFTGSDFSTDDGQTWQLFDQTDLRGISGTNLSCWAVGKDGIAAELMR